VVKLGDSQQFRVAVAAAPCTTASTHPSRQHHYFHDPISSKNMSQQTANLQSLEAWASSSSEDEAEERPQAAQKPEKVAETTLRSHRITLDKGQQHQHTKTKAAATPKQRRAVAAKLCLKATAAPPQPSHSLRRPQAQQDRGVRKAAAVGHMFYEDGQQQQASQVAAVAVSFDRGQ